MILSFGLLYSTYHFMLLDNFVACTQLKKIFLHEPINEKKEEVDLDIEETKDKVGFRIIYYLTLNSANLTRFSLEHLTWTLFGLLTKLTYE